METEAKKQTSGKDTLIIFLFLVGVIFLLFRMCSGFKTDDDGLSKSTAIVASENYVKQMLKSPATAKFTLIKTINISKEKVEVRQYVDSQNGFGAIIRNEYSCTVERIGNGKVKVSDFDMTNN